MADELADYINSTKENVEKAFDSTVSPKDDTEQKIEEKNENQMQYEKQKEYEQSTDEATNILYRLYDRDQNIPKKCIGSDSTLTKVYPTWKYNMTMGDMEKRLITHYDGKQETLWFPLEEYPDDYEVMKSENEDSNKKKKRRKTKVRPLKKVFVAFKIKRISDINEADETFTMAFHIYFNWMISESDYKSYYKASKMAKEENNPQILYDWEPQWYPELEFENMCEEITREWVLYPHEGCFRIENFKDFSQNKGEKKEDHEFDCMNAKFIRAKLECEMSFTESFELQSFPFDCQDLKCLIKETSLKSQGIECVFLPQLRRPRFSSLDPSISKIEYWDIAGYFVDFGHKIPDDGGIEAAMFIISLKLTRRWKAAIFDNIVIVLLSLLSFATFSIHFEDVANRLGYTSTLLLTSVLFDTKQVDVSYSTFINKFALSQQAFLVLITFYCSFADYLDSDLDDIMLYIMGILYLLECVALGGYAYYVRKEERKKCFMSFVEVNDYLKGFQKERPKLQSDFTTGRRNKDWLTFGSKV
eukprot:406429_1